MKQKITFFLALFMVAMTIFMPMVQAAGYTAGTYTGAAPGLGGEITVEVTFSDSAIEKVEIVNHSETPGISDPAIKDIPQSIVQHQSLGLDAISGATITSQAILEAVANTVEQAGGDLHKLQEKVEIKAEDAHLEADVVVIGGGIAGLSTAIEAVDLGAKVILLEKMANTGGATAVSGGECLAAGTQMQADDGVEDTWEALADYWVEKGEGQINEEMVRTIAQMAPENILWMKDNGVEFMDTMQTPTAMPWQSPKRTHRAANGEGNGFTDPLRVSAENKGVQVLVSTPATGLMVEEEKVVGVTGTTQTGGQLTVKANYVVLATGGYDSNIDLINEYTPSIHGALGRMGEAHMGDGLLWAKELGSPIIANDGGIVLSINYFTNTTGEFDPYGIFLYVNSEGQRFMNEGNYWFNRSREMLNLTGNLFYTIMDHKTLEQGAALEKGMEAGAVFKADTLEELAAQIGMEEKALVETVNAYNEACKKGVDEAFGKEAEKLIAIDTAPYFAAVNTFNANSGSFGGPKIDNSCKVLDGENNPIPGLYAVGEVANGEIFYREYPCSGSAIQSYMAMGRIAARDMMEK